MAFSLFLSISLTLYSLVNIEHHNYKHIAQTQPHTQTKKNQNLKGKKKLKEPKEIFCINPSIYHHHQIANTHHHQTPITTNTHNQKTPTTIKYPPPPLPIIHHHHHHQIANTHHHKTHHHQYPQPKHPPLNTHQQTAKNITNTHKIKYRGEDLSDRGERGKSDFHHHLRCHQAVTFLLKLVVGYHRERATRRV